MPDFATRWRGGAEALTLHRNCSEEEREHTQGEVYKLLHSEAFIGCVFVALAALNINVRAGELCLVLASWRV